MGTLALGDLLGSFRGDDVSGLVHVPINVWAKGDVGVVAVIPSLSQQIRVGLGSMSKLLVRIRIHSA